MPNWVFNTVSIRGKDEEVTAIREFVKGDDSKVSFANIYAPADPDAYSSGWYEWNLRNWGTKWDACEADVEYERLLDKTSLLTLIFQTAWSAPEPIIDWFVDLAKRFNLELNWYFEEEQGWGGELKVIDGELTIRTWDIPTSHAEYEALEKEDLCLCTWSSDQDEWFDDCPRGED